MPNPISDYALFGNLHSAALVSRQGSIDWFCPPRFDAPACFSALLGGNNYGYWSIQPRSDEFQTRRFYHEDTLILENRFTNGGSEFAVVDFMPIGCGCSLIRKVRGIRGNSPFRMECAPRFFYGRDTPKIDKLTTDAGRSILFQDIGDLSAVAQDVTVEDAPGPNTSGALFLFSDLFDHCRIDPRSASVVLDLDLPAGAEHYFILQHSEDPDATTTQDIDLEDWLDRTERWWRDWLSRCNYDGEYTGQVKRSLCVIKALTYQPSGGILAAPTTSLPEHIGGEANWDYRFCWLRDAALALDVLMGCNYRDEAMQWRDWLLKATDQHHDPLRPLYTIDGNVSGEETELDWLPGYANSRPVRIGNAAGDQHQMDVFGELMDVFHVARATGLGIENIWDLQKELLDHLAESWDEPDVGFWEFRDDPAHLTLSKVMAWVAFDRCILDAERYDRLSGELERWRQLRDSIREDVLSKGVDPELNRFVDRYGAKGVDASLLLIPIVGFLPADDPRVVNTVAAIEEELCHDGLVYRIRTEHDSWYNKEGAFLLCSFWMVDNYWMAGRKKEARGLFERLVTLTNDLGLYAEEYDPKDEQLLGNFPQTLTHLGLVNSARLIAGDRVLRGG